jgi:ATP-dependent DNA helicase
MSVTENNTDMENQQQPQAETSPNAVASAAPALAGSDDAIKADASAEASLSVKKEDGEAKPAATMNGSTTNGCTAAAAVVKEEPPVGDDDEEDASSIKSEGADEEDALFTKLEQEEEAEEAAHPHKQPIDAAAAPTLLKAAIEKGDVKMDESEHGAMDDAKEEQEHVHKRENQLEFLLAKASEFSSFISKDLEELQEALTAKAVEKDEKSDKRKKRKGGSAAKGSAKKKGKGNSGEALKTALVKDAVSRTGSNAIFIQPPNLAPGCYLKDYQLEGVRWLTSLWENGVSGILADGT